MLQIKISHQPVPFLNPQAARAGSLQCLQGRTQKVPPVRAKVEHILAIVKHLYVFCKMCVRGMRKQQLKPNTLFALVNSIWLAGYALLVRLGLSMATLTGCLFLFLALLLLSSMFYLFGVALILDSMSNE